MRRRHIHFLFFIWFLFLGGKHSFAQVLNTDYDIAEIEIDRNDGSSAVSNRMCISSDGYLWYTTYNGLVKSFGNASVLFPFDDGLLDGLSIFTDLIEDSKGDMWFATDRGLHVFNVSTAEIQSFAWKNPKASANTIIREIAELDNGNILALTERNLLLEFDYSTKEFITYRIPVGDYVKPNDSFGFDDFLVNIEDILPSGGVVLSQFNKFYLFKNKEIKKIADYSHIKQNGDNRSKIQSFENGKFFPSLTSGTYTFKGNSFDYYYIPEINRHFIQFPTSDFYPIIYDISNTSKVKFGRINPKNTNQLLFYGFDSSKTELIEYDEQVSLKEDIRGFVGSLKNLIYASTARRIYAIRPKRNIFNSFLTDEKNKTEDRVSIRGFASTKTGDLYIASYDGLFKLEKDGDKAQLIDKSFLTVRGAFKGSYRSLLFKDPFLWSAGEEMKFKKIDFTNESVQEFDLSTLRNDPSIRILCLEPWGSDKMLLGTNRGIFSFDFTTEQITDESILNLKNDLRGSNIQDIYVSEDNENKVWIASSAAGVFVKDFQTDSVSQYTRNNTQGALSSNIVFTIHKGQDQNMYFGTYGGLAVLSSVTNKFLTYDKNDGLASNIIVRIEESEENLWLSTFKGLVAYDKNNNRFYNFFNKDGLPDNEFNRESSFKDSAGNLYFGGLNGFIKFDPKQITFERPKERIELIGLEYYDVETDTIVYRNTSLKNNLAPIYLPYDKNFLNISYAIPNPFEKNTAIYEYQIEGQSDGYRPLGNDMNLRLNALPSGKHLLKIRGKDASGNPTINSITVPIEVNEIFYRRKRFIFICVLLLAILAGGFYEFRKYRWKEKLRQQRTIDRLESKALRAQMNPHFIFNSLNGLQSTMILKGEREANVYLGAFSSLLRSTLDMSKSDLIGLDEEIKYLTAYLNLERLRQARPLNFNIKIMPEDLNTQSIFIPCMIFQPILENAIIHGLAPKRDGDSFVEVSFKDDGNFLIGTVMDNGIGREAAAILKASNRMAHKSWATSIMQERIEIMNKYSSMAIDFHIEDLYENGKAAGTKVTIKLPL